MASSVQNSKISQSQFCMCYRVCNMWCWRVFKWIPVLLIVSIVTWSYYAYVIQLCIFTIKSTVQQCIYLIVFHILLFMFAWSYWRTIFAEIKSVPDKYKLPEAELQKLLSAESEDAQRNVLEYFAKDLPIVTRLVKSARIALQHFGVVSDKETKKDVLERIADSIPVLTRTMSGSVRYCNRCVLIKPDRAHHCSICARCVLKMDHHCPWVNNCVCYFNYKFFILFLGYALLYCLFIMATCLPYFYKFWKGDFGTAASSGRYHIVFAFFVSLMFAISLGSLFGYHCYLLANNRTTLDEMAKTRGMRRLISDLYSRKDIDFDLLLSFRRFGSPTRRMINSVVKSMVDEAFRAPMFRGGADKNGFSIGAYSNFKEVFGNSPNLWMLPVFTSLGDGCDFPVRREHEMQAYTAQQEAHGYESMGITRSSFGDGIVYPVPQPEEDTESLLSAERWDRWGERARPFDDRESSSCDEL